MYVERLGAGPRLVLVHGSVTSGSVTWAAQRSLADRFELMIVERPGYAPNPPLPAIDFEIQAAELAAVLEPGDHLVGHSYGGVICLLAAVRAPLGSLTVIEPPALSVARGHPAVEDFLQGVSRAPRDPRGYLEHFLPLVGSRLNLPDPLPPQLDAAAKAALVERSPHEAEIPLDDLAAERFAKLVVSGAHNTAFDAICDILEQRIGAERAVVAGAGHGIPRVPEFNDVLTRFLARV